MSEREYVIDFRHVVEGSLRVFASSHDQAMNIIWDMSAKELIENADDLYLEDTDIQSVSVL